MSYRNVADIADSGALFRRITAAAAQEDIMDPSTWVQIYRWELAAQPGWGDAWASAEASGVENPGGNEGVITDSMILSAVQALNTPDE